MKNIKKLLGAIAFSVLITGASAQTVYKNYQDGKIYFQVKDGYGLKSIEFNGVKKYVHVKELNIKSLQNQKSKSVGKNSVDYYNIPLSKFPFLEKMAQKYDITKLAMPFFAAKTSDALQHTYRVTFGNIHEVNDFINQLKATGDVVFAERVPLHKEYLTPNDPDYASYQWYLQKINAPQAWNYTTGSHSIVVADVDNAVDINHQDLSANVWTNPGEIPGNGIDDDGNGYVDDVHGWDVGDNDNDVTPPNSTFDHGTHTAGLIDAVGGNNTGIASIGYGVSLMPVKATKNSAGSESVTNGFDGITYAAANGAKVISCSWGGTGSSTAEQNVINYAWSQGAIIVCAAGNDGNSTLHYPAAYNHVFSVAATDDNDQLASFSCYGSWVDICSPGVNIYSTLPSNQYGYMSGTSMATPIVSGLCGLILSLNPGMTQTDVINCIESTADNINSENPGYSGEIGSGRIDAAAAMACASSTLNNAPVADFTANYTTVLQGATVSFTDLSAYSPTSWSWTFGGGGTPNTSTTENPNIVFNTPGTYTVSLTATNAHGSNTATKTNYITVLASTGCDTVSEVKLATDTGYTYSLASPPTNQYQGGENSYGMTKWVAYTPSALYAPNTAIQSALFAFTEAYSSSPTSDSVVFQMWDNTGAGGLPGSVIAGSRVALPMSQIMSDVHGGYFTVVTFHNPVSISGDFYIGYTIPSNSADTLAMAYTQNLAGQSGRINTAYTYADGSNTNFPANWYSLSNLFAGSPSMDPYVFLAVTEHPVNALISPQNVTLCQDSILTMSGTGSANAATYKWYFSGSSTTDSSSSATPSINFNQTGTQKVYLIARNSCGMPDVDSTTVTVNPAPTVYISATNDTICNGSSTSLTAHGATNYVWSNGIPNGAGPHSVSPTSNTTYNVVGTNTSGCSSSANYSIVVNQMPTASASYSPTSNICKGDAVSFSSSGSTNVTSYNWTFTGGNPATSTSANPSVVFATAGNHSYQLTVTNSCGTDNASGSVTVGSCGSNLIANFSANNTTVCQGGTVTFTDNSTGSPTSWNWTFTGGTPATATGQGPHTVTYNTSGTYQVKLIISDGTYYDTLSLNNYITVNSLPNVIASANNNTICNGSSTQLYASGASTYTWSPSTGLSSTSGSSVTASPTTTTTYTVTGTSSAGCLNTAQVTVTVTSAPIASASYNPSSNICPGDAVSFDATGSSNASSYSWSFTGGTPSTSASATPSITFATAGTKSFSLTATNAGCSDTYNGSIVIDNCAANQVHANFEADTTQVCQGGSVNFTDLSTNNPTSWLWIFSGGTPGTSTAQNPGPIQYTNTGNYNVQLIASNANGSDTATFTNYIHVVVCTGIGNIKANKNIGAVYSGSDKNVTLTVDNVPDGEYSVAVFNSIGQYVIKSDVTVNAKRQQFKYDMAKFSKGMYIIRLIGKNEQYSSKFVKY